MSRGWKRRAASLTPRRLAWIRNDVRLNGFVGNRNYTSCNFVIFRYFVIFGWGLKHFHIDSFFVSGYERGNIATITATR